MVNPQVLLVMGSHGYLSGLVTRSIYMGKYPNMMSGLALRGGLWSKRALEGPGKRCRLGPTRALVRPEKTSRGRLQNAVKTQRSRRLGKKGSSRKKNPKKPVNLGLNSQMPSVVRRLHWGGA